MSVCRCLNKENTSEVEKEEEKKKRKSGEKCSSSFLLEWESTIKSELQSQTQC